MTGTAAKATEETPHQVWRVQDVAILFVLLKKKEKKECCALKKITLKFTNESPILKCLL